MVFRATRGNSFVRTHELATAVVDPVSGESVMKNVLAVFFHGSRLRTKIVKLCESYGATLYPYPEDSSELVSVLEQVRRRSVELGSVLSQTEEQRKALLVKIAGALELWSYKVTVEKAVFHTMNKMDWVSSDRTVTAEVWVPARSVEQIRVALMTAERTSKASVGCILTPVGIDHLPVNAKPTYFETNEVTQAFQDIVESYGVARYKEINPAVFAIITFPFLFAVMFGDWGHGILLTLFGLWLLFSAKKFKRLQAKRQLNEILGMMFGGRWVIVFMGLFSIYVGILYNDWFALSFDWFGTTYTFHETMKDGKKVDIGTHTVERTYPIGIDPAWYGTTNKLTFYNSLKMKLSVLLGVIHMLVGVCMGLLNMIYRSDWFDVVVEFIPMFVFLAGTFGYMCILIIIKWNIDWSIAGREAPSLLQTMTDFFLSPGTVQAETFSGQAAVQAVLLLVAFLVVPVLLLGKPLHERAHHKKLHGGSSSHANQASGFSTGSETASDESQIALHRHGQHHHDGQSSASGHNGTAVAAGGGAAALAVHEEEFQFGDVMVKQIIHTIEYVLGCISNTASYLRLWALSLAHAQLSEVFWEMIFLLAIKADVYGIFVYVGFAVWAAATVGVLLCMEALSAFLHALRLHWVEFMNKFYAGDGIKFAPFDFKHVLAAAAEAAAQEHTGVQTAELD
nr:vacuolar H(+)-ATPase 100 kDa subunit [Andalucia godoyi]